ncbi:hypothetical protein [Lysobacter gummosus]|uniref:hypothetical protein n=1 Tax=Lysobacter gummosus TaxID=262324 RepID=UPI003638B7E1
MAMVLRWSVTVSVAAMIRALDRHSSRTFTGVSGRDHGRIRALFQRPVAAARTHLASGLPAAYARLCARFRVDRTRRIGLDAQNL